MNAAILDEHLEMLERLISQIREDIERSLESPRDLAQYAREAGVSTGHLPKNVLVAMRPILTIEQNYGVFSRNQVGSWAYK